MIITEFTVDHPILREPMRRVADIDVEWEQTFKPSDGPPQMVVWVETEDVDGFEAAIGVDTGVTNPELITELGDRRLYRLEFTPLGRRMDLYSKVTEAGGIFQEVLVTVDGWRLQIQFPDRDALNTIYEFCRDHDIGFEFHRIFEQTDWNDADGSALTDEQRQILSKAAECGYLSIPRDCSLATLGSELGISESAASERFRRGVRTLIDESIA